METFLLILMFAPLGLIGLGFVVGAAEHIVGQLNLWKETENKTPLLKKWLFRELPISVIVFVILGVIFHQITSPETQQEKNEKAYIALNQATKPLVEWCNQNLNEQVYEHKLINDVGEHIVTTKVRKCFENADYRQEMLNNLSISHKKLLSDGLKKLNQDGHFDRLNKQSGNPSDMVINDFALAKSTAKNADTYDDSYGIALACKGGFLLGGEAIGYSFAVENSKQIIQKDIKAGERDCYEINWISFRTFKNYVDDCWQVGCKIIGYVNENDELTGLQVEPAALEDLLKYEIELEQNTLQEIILKVEENLGRYNDLDKSTWDNIVSMYWQNN